MAPDLRLICTAARGTERALEHELSALGASSISRRGSSLLVQGDWSFVARANVFSRIASKVLLELLHFEAASEAELVEALARFSFEEHLRERDTFAIEAHLRDAPWSHTLYAAQRVKDVIVDRMRAKKRGRPDVDVERPRVRFVLHWEGSTVTLSKDTTGIPLFKRGYRREQGPAPMKETLAAAILAIAHADVRRPFLDPCCGSGTLAIEQAMRSLDRAPALGRHFAFERWSDATDEMREALKQARTEAKDRAKSKLEAPIRLSDWHEKAVGAAEANVAAAGLSSHLRVERADARRVEPPGARPVVVTNLPFGERLGRENKLQLEGFYRTLGAHLGSWPGARLAFFSAHENAEGLLGLTRRAGRPRRWALASGALKATLLRWDVPDEPSPQGPPAEGTSSHDDDDER